MSLRSAAKEATSIVSAVGAGYLASKADFFPITQPVLEKVFGEKAPESVEKVIAQVFGVALTALIVYVGIGLILDRVFKQKQAVRATFPEEKQVPVYSFAPPDPDADPISDFTRSVQAAGGETRRAGFEENRTKNTGVPRGHGSSGRKGS